MKVLGIDPGTKSFDLCGLENGEVYFEEILDTSEVAKKPELLIEATEKAMPLDLIAGPSGYGVELTYLRDLNIQTLKDWYLTYILLLKEEDLEAALKKGNIGIMVYSAMTETAMEMKRRDWPVCYIPGVIELPTVPAHRKINKLDMGTVDKMCIGVLGVYDQAKKLNIPYSEVSFILVEMGFGYNAVLGISEGKIVDGIGGTTGGIGFLTAGGMDAELMQLVGNWEKVDIFTGGGISVSGKLSPEELIECSDADKRCEVAWGATIEGIVKGVASMMTTVPHPKEILISGRLTRVEKVKDELLKRLAKFAPVRRIGWLQGARRVKESAQGYAIVADGLAGGKFVELIEWMGIKNAKGTALDHIYHPKGKSIRQKLEEKISFRP
ncbi:MAG: butyrate kinase [Hadesarchaea archaeon B3_Hades]|nr:MAG: butyrate kinase [Hadesarchaea archaeon B3_Hades]